MKAVSKENATKLHLPLTLPEGRSTKRKPALKIDEIFVKKEQDVINISTDSDKTTLDGHKSDAEAQKEEIIEIEDNDNSDSGGEYVQYNGMNFTQEGAKFPVTQREIDKLTDELLDGNSDESMMKHLAKEEEDFRRKFLMDSSSDEDWYCLVKVVFQCGTS